MKIRVLCYLHILFPDTLCSNFFKRVRARYYVFSAVNPSKEVLDALIEAKKTWDNKDAQVTIIPTHETETLCNWMSVNQEVNRD